MDRNLLHDCKLPCDPNFEFGVGECLSTQEDASPSVLPVPQFVSEDLSDGYFPVVPDVEDSRFGNRLTRSPNPWDPRLVVDLALAIDPLEAILERFALDASHYERLLQIPAFRRDLAMTMRELREDGVTFAKKAAVQAESYLLDVDELVQNKAVAASTRLDAIKSVVKWGNLEGDKTGKGVENQGVQVNLQINFT